MQKLFLILVVIFALASAKPAFAQEQVCTSAYGGGVVCGIKTHQPVNTGLIDDLPLLGPSFILVSGALFALSRKLKLSKVS
ncbi:MAG TPA: hypothetical protein VL401_00830 [Alphaproteobacteria bacterium]|jgi:hypothetical protein|nr:hypothetical protein [Alphaproteobacteria bacterium]